MLFAAIAIGFFAKAQKSDSTVTIIFAGEKNASSYSKKKKKDSDAYNAIKVAPTGIFVGQIPLVFERKLSPNISIQVGAGLTNQNFLRTAFVKASSITKNITSDYPWSSSSSTSYDQADELYSFEKRKVEMGTMFAIQPKFYLNDDALDGGFIGFGYNSYSYKFSHPRASAYNSSSIVFKGSDQAEKEKITDFMVYYGIQSISGHFSFEYSTGIGLRKVKGEKYAAAYDYNTSKILDGFVSYQQTLFNYEMAFRIGYVF